MCCDGADCVTDDGDNECEGEAVGGGCGSQLHGDREDHTPVELVYQDSGQ